MLHHAASRQIRAAYAARGNLLLLAIGSCLALAGCGGPGYEVVPVSGKVTLDEKPMANVHVSFQPISEGKDNPNPGPGSFAVTDSEGRYELRIVDPDRPGAVVGRHRVRLAVNQPDVGAGSDLIVPVKKVLPASAGDGSIKFAVPPEGTDKADFPLKSR